MDGLYDKEQHFYLIFYFIQCIGCASNFILCKTDYVYWGVCKGKTGVVKFKFGELLHFKSNI